AASSCLRTHARAAEATSVEVDRWRGEHSRCGVTAFGTWLRVRRLADRLQRIELVLEKAAVTEERQLFLLALDAGPHALDEDAQRVNRIRRDVEAQIHQRVDVLRLQ